MGDGLGCHNTSFQRPRLGYTCSRQKQAVLVISLSVPRTWSVPRPVGTPRVLCAKRRSSLFMRFTGSYVVVALVVVFPLRGVPLWHQGRTTSGNVTTPQRDIKNGHAESNKFMTMNMFTSTSRNGVTSATTLKTNGDPLIACTFVGSCS